MKYLSILLVLITPLSGFAGPMGGSNPYGGMDPAQLQNMVAEMQNCMKGMDFTQMEGLKQRGEAMETEIKALCKNGDRDAAMSKALAYSKEIRNAPEVEKIRTCSEKVRGMMPDAKQFDKFNEDSFKNSHVCDELK